MLEGLVDHMYVCPRCGGGGEWHYIMLREDEVAPDTWEFHGDDCEHDPACASDDQDRVVTEGDTPPVGEDGTA